MIPGASIHPGESVLTIRKHWFLLVLEVLGIVFGALLPLVGYALVGPFLPPHTRVFLPTLALFFYTIYLLILWLGFFILWTDYMCDVWIVTPQKIVAVELRGLFYRIISEFSMERIQTITVETRGILPALIGYGILHVETAGSERAFIFRGAPNPEFAKSLILSYHAQSIHHSTSSGGV
ncbi:MAG: PH domain-containing protein [Parcubacteria group bacterium]|nr:PH domain-containing protein [Parcubacteria group bacterium]